LAKYLPSGDTAETTYALGVVQGEILEQMLKQCGNDLSRENIIKQALNLKNYTPSLVLPGIAVNTSAGNHQAWTTLQLQQFNGKNWSAIGKLISVVD
jgi:branched-chain amino acid transport system substrate-binding protein